MIDYLVVRWPWRVARAVLVRTVWTLTVISYGIQIQLLRLLRILVTLLTWQYVSNLLKLSIALLNMTLMAYSAPSSFPSLCDYLLCFLGLVRDVGLGWLL